MENRETLHIDMLWKREAYLYVSYVALYQNLTFYYLYYVYMCNLFEPKTEIVLFSAHLSSLILNMVLKTMSFVECLYIYIHI